MNRIIIQSKKKKPDWATIEILAVCVILLFFIPPIVPGEKE